MKKLILPILLIWGLTTQAQNREGTTWPLNGNIVFNDINGNPVDFLSYLNQGKTIIMDLSSTWCGYCWQFHETHQFDTLWKYHGIIGQPGVSPNSTNDVLVLFVEGDVTTDHSELIGQVPSAFGDWTAGVKYPIVDLQVGDSLEFNENFRVNDYPHFYRICPERTITELPMKWNEDGVTSTAADIYADAIVCQGLPNSASDVSGVTFLNNKIICTPENYTPKIIFQNHGTDTLTSATVTIKNNGTTVSTGTFSGNLPSLGFDTIVCTTIPNFNGGILTAIIHAAGDTILNNDTLFYQVNDVQNVTNVIDIHILTDSFPEEIHWHIEDAAGLTVPGTVNPTLPVTAARDFTYVLPALGCYSYHISDDNFDGFGFYGGEISVKSGPEVLFSYAFFNNPVRVGFKVTQMVAYAGIGETDQQQIILYPNPARGSFTLQSDKQAQYEEVELTDLTGRVIQTWKITESAETFETSGISTGDYLVVVKGKEGRFVRKLRINN